MSNLAKASDILLLEEINLKNVNKFTRNVLDFGLPVVTTEQGRNTKIRINAAKGSQYSGWQDVWYNRLDIAELFSRFGHNQVELPRSKVSTSVDAVRLLNTIYGLALSDNEVVSSSITTDQFDLVIHSESLAYFGALKIQLIGDLIPLDSVLTVQVLDGLWYPDAVVDHLITPVVVEGILALHATTPEGLLYTGDSANNMLIATNNELEIALRVGYVSNTPEINPIGTQYSLSLQPSQDWNFPFSIALLNTVSGTHIDELYDIRLFLQSHQTDAAVELTLVRDDTDQYWLRNDELGISVALVYQAEDRLLLQDAPLCSAYTQFLEGVTTNGAGAGLGEFEVGLAAYRRNAIVPRLAVIANVVATAEVL